MADVSNIAAESAIDAVHWHQIAALLPSPIKVLDIGARAGIESKWTILGRHVTAYGFEPDPDECVRLNNDSDGRVQYVPKAIGASSGEEHFYITRDPFCSSLLPPIERLARDYPRLTAMRTQEIVTIQTQTIDDWTRENDISRIDHLKLDVQGAELAVLEGSARSLGTVRSIKLEVQFGQLYERAPLFGDVDRYLRERDFELWRLSELSHCSIGEAGMSVTVPEILDYDSRRVEVAAGGGRLLWANAYYVRRQATRPSASIRWDDAIRDACLANVHRYADLAELSLLRARHDAPRDVKDALVAAGAPRA